MDMPETRATPVGGRLAGLVYARLKRQLLSGVHEAGTPLHVVNLREEFGVSKQPIMEALRALSTERLVEIQPQVGVRVSSFPPHEVQGFFDIFARSEGAMARRAATRRTEAQLAELERLCRRLEALEETAEGGAAYMDGNRAVHLQIHAMAGSFLAADVSAGLWDLSDFLIATHGTGFDDGLAARNHGHREVLDAIRARDEDAAERAMVQHILLAPIPGVDADVAV